ncbi:MAG: IS4 family transposase [Bacteroidaceae bacterium]
MNVGKYVFAQIVQFLPKRYFERLVSNYKDRTARMAPSYWSHILAIMYGQLIGCHSLRELTDITVAHGKRSFHLGFGKVPINRSVLSKANNLRSPEIFEKFAFHIMSIAQAKRTTKEFELHGRFYAIDSTTIDLCMSVFKWAKFRSTKSGIKVHTQIDIATEIPVFYRISHANVHDTRSMDWLKYERQASYVFDRAYFDLSRLFAIEQAGAFFIIREKSHPEYEITEGEDMLEGAENVLRDQTVRFTGKRNSGNYPVPLRRIVFYAPDLGRTFTYYTNNFYLKGNEIALLYRYRWQVELFFKWIKQHLRVKSFWGESENAVRIQIHVAITTYCLVAIIEHDLKLGRPIVEVMRILGHSLLVKDPIHELLAHEANKDCDDNDCQLHLDFKSD